MERMNARPVIFPGLMLIFLTFVFVLAGVARAGTIQITEDSFITSENQIQGTPCGNVNFSSPNNYGTLNCNVVEQATNVNIMHTYAYMKFNATPFSSIISGLTFDIPGYQENSQPGGNKHIYFLPNNSWNESTITYNNANLSFSQIGYISMTNSGSPNAKSANLVSNNLSQKFIQALYSGQETSLVMVGFEDQVLSYGGPYTGNSYTLSTKEAGGAPLLNYTTVDYLPGYVHAVNAHSMYFDFETGKWNETDFQEADVFYDVDNNQMFLYNGVYGFFNGRDSYESNDTLGTTDCTKADAESYTYHFENILSDPTPLYDTFCFNLSANHAGQKFTGAIKMINRSTYCLLGDCHDVDFYWAMYSPNINVFGVPVLNPNPPMEHMNVTIQWTTSKDTYGKVKIRYNNTDTGNYTNWFYLFDDNQSYRTYHMVTLNSEDVKPSYYQLYMLGNTTDGTNYTSILYAFYVRSADTVFTNTNDNSTIPGALDRIKDSGFCDSRTGCLYIVTAIIIGGLSACAFFFGNKKFGMLVLFGSILVFGFLGWLPAYVVIPILILAIIPIVKLFRSVLGGGN